MDYQALKDICMAIAANIEALPQTQEPEANRILTQNIEEQLKLLDPLFGARFNLVPVNENQDALNVLANKEALREVLTSLNRDEKAVLELWALRDFSFVESPIKKLTNQFNLQNGA